MSIFYYNDDGVDEAVKKATESASVKKKTVNSEALKAKQKKIASRVSVKDETAVTENSMV